MEGKRSQEEAGIPPSPFHESLSVHPTQNTRAAKTAVVARPNGAVLWDRWASGLKEQGKAKGNGSGEDTALGTCSKDRRAAKAKPPLAIQVKNVAEGTTADTPLRLVPGPRQGSESRGAHSLHSGPQNAMGEVIIIFPQPQIDLHKVGIPPGHSAKHPNPRWQVTRGRFKAHGAAVVLGQLSSVFPRRFLMAPKGWLLGDGLGSPRHQEASTG